MKGKTHVVVGLMSGLTTYAALQVSGVEVAEFADAPLLLAGAGLGALIPDIDHTESMISKLPEILRKGMRRRRGFAEQLLSMVLFAAGSIFRAIAYIIHRLFGHRTLTHSLLGVGLFACLSVWLGREWNEMISIPIGLFIGYVSHLAADAGTPSGVPLLWPVSSRRFRFPRTVPTGSASEGKLAVLFTLATFALAIVIIWFEGYL